MNCARSKRGWNRSSAHPERGVVLALLIAGCAPAPQSDRVPEPRAMESLRAAIAATDAAASFRAVGRGRFVSKEGTLEGQLTVRSDPPDRAWVEFRTGALFGLVAERVVIGMPGDAHVLVYRAREEVLDRFHFEESVAAGLGLWGGLGTLQALAIGSIPWPDGAPPPDLESRTRSIGTGKFGIALEPQSGPGELILDVRDGRLRELTWRSRDRNLVQVRYDRYEACGTIERPMRVRLRAPSAGVEADVEWDRLEIPAQFGPADFEVGSRNPPPGRGVQGG